MNRWGLGHGVLPGLERVWTTRKEWRFAVQRLVRAACGGARVGSVRFSRRRPGGRDDERKRTKTARVRRRRRRATCMSVVSSHVTRDHGPRASMDTRRYSQWFRAQILMYRVITNDRREPRCTRAPRRAWSRARRRGRPRRRRPPRPRRPPPHRRRRRRTRARRTARRATGRRRPRRRAAGPRPWVRRAFATGGRDHRHASLSGGRHLTERSHALSHCT